MPQTFKKYKNPMQDGRRKLDPSKHEEIREKYKSGGYSWKSLAKEYEVSKKLIGLIVNPAMAAKMKERNKEVWKDYNLHYGKEAHRLAIAKWRAKKKKLGLVVKANDKVYVDKTCYCGTVFNTYLNTRIYCSPKCKDRTHRAKKRF